MTDKKKEAAAQALDEKASMEASHKLARRVVEKIAAARPYRIGSEFAGLLIKLNEEERDYMIESLKECGIWTEVEEVKARAAAAKKKASQKTSDSEPSEKKSNE